MPVTHARQDVRPLDIPIPLVTDDLQATLRIPSRMSEEDFDVLITLINANLNGMKRAIVKPLLHLQLPTLLHQTATAPLSRGAVTDYLPGRGCHHYSEVPGGLISR